VNLTKLESRPIIGRPWSYRFYIDLELDWNDPKGWRIQEKLDREADSIVHLGTYKKGEIPIN
jgi:prephenate dehydratase